VQMAGWFRNPIKSLADLKGLKMRIPGLGGEVMARLGVTQVNMPGGEIFSSLQSGTIDAAEWVGPYNDLAFGFQRITKYCYYPGWHEPGSNIECMVNKPAFEALPKDLQKIVETCCQAANAQMLAEYTARNQQALDVLQNEHGVQFLPLPDDVIAALKTAAQQVLDEVAAGDAMAKKVYESLRKFQAQAKAWHAYGKWGTTPGPLYAVGVLVTLFAAVWRFRRRPWRDAADAMLFTFGGFGLLIVSVATSLFDYRYGEPAVLLIPVGLALAVNRIVALAKTPAAPADPVETPADVDSEPATAPIEPAATPAN